MDIFDIIGPVMVGPSSSHTAGVVRIGNVVNRVLGGVPERAEVWFHGSFAATWRGHGSDKAIAAGMLGFGTDDIRIRDSLSIAREQGFDMAFRTIVLENAHPNTILIEASRRERTVRVRGISVGGGNIQITELDGIGVDFDGKHNTMIVRHRDSPGAVAQVSGALAEDGINIAGMKVHRARRGGDAIMVIETDEALDGGLCAHLAQVEGIQGIITLPCLF